jgi:hypothetical protein
MTFRVGGRGHRTLDALASGPQAHADLVDLIARSDDPRDERAAHFLILALKDHGLTAERDCITRITAKGLEALADLDAGIPAYSEEPTPRVTYCRRVA